MTEAAQTNVGDMADSDDDFQYEEVEVLSEEDDDVSEDLDAAMRHLQGLSVKKESGSTQQQKTDLPGQVTRRMEVIDDFIRNFFVKMGLSRTSEVFESEWYELKAVGKIDHGTAPVPDVYLHNTELEDTVRMLHSEVSEARSIAAKASATWDKFRKERDFHRMHHKRVAQEKNKLITDIRRLKEHYSKYEPTILELKRKYEAAMKEKMLVSLERDKLAARVEAMEAQLSALQPDGMELPSASAEHRKGALDAAATSKSSTNAATTSTAGGAGGARKATWSPLPAGMRKNPYEGADITPASVTSYSCQKTFKGHLLSVSNVALHPTKPILVTASDDKTWKMWHLPHGDLIMSGEGHKDWVGGIDFHPRGMCLASGSGDGSVKLWDFEKQSCVATFTDHKLAVWSVKFHDMGNYVASASLDHSVRLWDVTVGRCRQVMRGHVDSVNDIAWQPFTNNLGTSSSDKTVSIWDARTALCSQTFYGHQNSCNAIAFNKLGTVVASSDADGIVKLWDVRMIAEITTFNTGKLPANKCCFDSSGTVLAVACDDGKVKCIDVVRNEMVMELVGHEDAVQACVFDPNNQYLITAGSDNTFRMWA